MMESNRIEYKRELTDALEKEAVAFFNNRDGGVIYIGIDDSKAVVGIPEAVINAIIHNDYTSEAVPKFEIFDDRLELTSAGYIQPGEEREDFFAGYSIPRNKILMRIFKDLDMVEYLGSGMPRILKAYPKESYVFSSHFIRMVLPISLEALELEKELLAQADTEVKKHREKSSVKSSVKIIELITEDKFVTIPVIAEKLNITTRGIEKQISKLQANGVIRRIGPDKGGHWEIVENKK